MNARTLSVSDPARFARAIREVARDAHETLTHPAPPRAFRELSRRIEILLNALGENQGAPVRAWLERLGRDVDLSAKARHRSCRAFCLSTRVLSAATSR